MLSRVEAEFLRGEKQAKPQQLRYLKHCVRRKIKTLRENDLPAIMANEWARPLFQTAIGNNSGGAIDLNSASGLASRTEIYPSRTNDLRARGQVRIKASASGADNRGFKSRRARQSFRFQWFCHPCVTGFRDDITVLCSAVGRTNARGMRDYSSSLPPEIPNGRSKLQIGIRSLSRMLGLSDW